MSRLFLNQTVFDAGIERIERLFNEFSEVIVSFSGGKDSTICLNLALMVAERLNRLPLKVLFFDQEAEWQSTIDYARVVMNDPRVTPLWFQAPFKIFNAVSGAQPWLIAWEPGAAWMREKDPGTIQENITGADRFHDLFPKFTETYFPNTPVANIAGVRTEESAGRQKGCTSMATYKEITWGRVDNKKRGHYTFYPIYDWGWRDVWKAIHDHGWQYSTLYDRMYQYGVSIQSMRVSNVHHETAVNNLHFLQELEPETWDKVLARVNGVNAVSKAGDAYRIPETLPPMFANWTEYRDYLLENMIESEEARAKFRSLFRRYDAMFYAEALPLLVKCQISSLLVNDYHGTKLDGFTVSHALYQKNTGKKADKYSQQGESPVNIEGEIIEAFNMSDNKQQFISAARRLLNELSPQKAQPIDLVQWIPIEKITPNEYNPNSVAQVEMQLLYTSIKKDGYTQPVVTIFDADRQVWCIVDGFHRYYVMKTHKDIYDACNGRLPCVVIAKDINDRMASTVRHNRARGKHSIQGMSSMVFQMLENGWTDVEICTELGMSAEEILRLKHITGFSKLFKDTQYQKAWITQRQARIAKEQRDREAAP